MERVRQVRPVMALPSSVLTDANRRLRPYVALSAVALAFISAPASVAAHERWFVPDDEQTPPDWGDLLSLPVLIAVIASLAVVGALTVAERRLGDPLWPRPAFLQGAEPSAAAILGVQVATTMIFSATRLNLFVPNIDLPENALGIAIAGVMLVAAFSFITGVLARVGAAITVGLVVLGLAFAPWYEVLEQLLFVGIALYLVALGRGVLLGGPRPEGWSLGVVHGLVPHALTILRVTLAISLITLAFTEKLVAVELGEAFLREYPDFNLPKLAGIDWFTDRRFVYAAGIVECVSGAALLSGKLPRVVILALWLPFNAGIVFLPPAELIGHLPVLAIMYVLLVRGPQGIPARGEGAVASRVEAIRPMTA